MRAAGRTLLLLLAASAAARGGADYDYDADAADDYYFDPSLHQSCVPAGSRTVPIRCKPRGNQAECRGVASHLYRDPPTMLIGLPPARVNASDADVAPPYCATLLAIERGGPGACFERLSFRNFTVGWADLSIDTSSEDGDLVVDVNLLPSVGAIKQLASNSSTREFWDFSNPAFSAEGGVLNAVSFNLQTTNPAPCHVSLADIYNLGGTSIEELSIFSNKNNSTDLRMGPMPRLKVLRLVDCSIERFPSADHVQMPALETLDLSNNRLTSVPAAIAAMQKLKILNLSGASLQRLAGQLPPLPLLAELVLSNTSLCCLHQEQDAFQRVPNLLVLDISHNQLTSVGAALRGLRQLTFLDISNNQLTEYPELQPQNEAILSFSNNHLDTIPHCAQFGNSTGLLSLELQNNRISHWDGGPNMLRCVDSLNLANNSLANIDANMLASLDVVNSVTLSDNPLHCEGCAFEQLREWLRTTRVKVRAGGSDTGAANALRCATPPAVSGMSVGAVQVAGECAAAAAASASASGQGASPLVLGLSLGAAVLALLLAAATAAACYRYRFELAYSAHLLRLRALARSRRRKGNVDAFTFDAFILYSASDQPWVGGRLLALLEGPPRYRVCLHERALDGGAARTSLPQLLDSSRHVIVVLSRSFLSSTWCQWEMDLANHRTLDPAQREFIILLELEPLERSSLPRHLRFLMDTRTYLEWHQGGDHHYEEQAFRRLKGALGIPGPLPAATVADTSVQRESKL